MKNDAVIAKNSEIEAGYRQIKEKSGTMNGESGTMNGESGTMDSSEAKLYDIESQDSAVFAVVANYPGIKQDQIFLQVRTSIRSVQRTLGRLAKAKKIEYRGSKQKGGWYVKT